MDQLYPEPASNRGRFSRRLLILTALPALNSTDGRWLLPTKLISGMSIYAAHWPGEVILGLRAGVTPGDDLDNKWWAEEELPFSVVCLDFKELARAGHELLNGCIVLAMFLPELAGLASQCARNGGRLVVNIELTLRTRVQMAKATRSMGLGLLRHLCWLVLHEFALRREIRFAHGLQCNGLPTFEQYARRNSNPLLYFDNRASKSLLTTEERIESRLTHLKRIGRLRILFSGRLHPIKGADHLVPMAHALVRLGVDFELLIAGDGPLRASIESQISDQALLGKVRCLGTLDFVSELMPLLRDSIDLFACTHLQGDPSCTYLETMSAGVPIVGYSNEAWAGLHRISRSGRVVRISDTRGMASAIKELAEDLPSLHRLSVDALRFARQHVFETEFRERIDHLLGVARDA